MNIRIQDSISSLCALPIRYLYILPPTVNHNHKKPIDMRRNVKSGHPCIPGTMHACIYVCGYICIYHSYVEN